MEKESYMNNDGLSSSEESGEEYDCGVNNEDDVQDDGDHFSI